ncbi:Hypothetical predicted protein [Mytilus galloprovincialis]|uniref:Uncharacterized protein n=1 Tax=Mytilus galloprovincialis TaxID=29158 RepID=A0A8B6FLH9_MYTGA|nr:Hypothetical predicted protein [Mytilus galloprovincialis]
MHSEEAGKVRVRRRRKRRQERAPLEEAQERVAELDRNKREGSKRRGKEVRQATEETGKKQCEQADNGAQAPQRPHREPREKKREHQKESWMLCGEMQRRSDDDCEHTNGKEGQQVENLTQRPSSGPGGNQSHEKP